MSKVKKMTLPAKAWAIVTRSGTFADGRAGYALFDTRADAMKWFIDGDDERIARVEIRELP